MNRELDLMTFMGLFQFDISYDSMIIIFWSPKELCLKTVLFGNPYCWCCLYILLRKPFSLSKTSSGSQNGSEKRQRVKRCAEIAPTDKRQSREYPPFSKTVYTVDSQILSNSPSSTRTYKELILLRDWKLAFATMLRPHYEKYYIRT